jgi:predicted RNA-binding Zn-ribbon protein involved in translation (DUF1610 family)
MECPKCGNTRIMVEETGYSRLWDVSNELNPEGGLQLYESFYSPVAEGGDGNETFLCRSCGHEWPMTQEEAENAWYS